jgi:cellulose synthase operon protein C
VAIYRSTARNNRFSLLTLHRTALHAFALTLAIGCAGSCTSSTAPLAHAEPRSGVKPASPDELFLRSAISHHKRALDLKARASATRNHEFLSRAWKEYELATNEYRRFLTTFPHSPYAYEIRYSLAHCLYYSLKYLQAATVFSEVRDSKSDTRYREEAAFMATKSHEEFIKLAVAQGQLPNPPLPTANDKVVTRSGPPSLPHDYAEWQRSLDAYSSELPNEPKAPVLAYKAAEISLRFLDFKGARVRLARVHQRYCQNPISRTAAHAIIFTYRIEHNTSKAMEWVFRMVSEGCGGEPRPELLPEPSPAPESIPGVRPIGGR